tara:strand:- start:1396 stop:2070 length:675 start_codon:yes stop_codon:yes gene_type:complete
MRTINSILAIFYREYKITFSNFQDIFTILIFFLLGILIFVFSIGPNKEIFNYISVGIIWTLLLLSTNLSIDKFYKNDFKDGNIILLYISGLSFEVIVIIKILTMWFFFQLPFLLIIPIGGLILDIDASKMITNLYVFLIGSPILTSLASISGSMNLLNNKNFAISSIIIMILSIPLIIFSVGIVSATPELVKPQLNILLGILMLFLAITPWISAACIKLSIRNN